MSKEKGTSAQFGTGIKAPVVQKLHTTGEGNVKIKLNRYAAKKLLKVAPKFLRGRLEAAL